MNVELHIEELVLHGFPAADRQALAHEVTAELTRLLTERGVPQALAADATMVSIPGGSFTVTPTATARSHGAQIAQAIYDGMAG